MKINGVTVYGTYSDSQWGLVVCNRKELIQSLRHFVSDDGFMVDRKSIRGLKWMNKERVLVIQDMTSTTGDEGTDIRPYTHNLLLDLIVQPDEYWKGDTSVINWLRKMYREVPENSGDNHLNINITFHREVRKDQDEQKHDDRK
ncbi:hypothetical protein [Limosilactobacillus allomucosae]|uniref:hypothetical protein n=1 Tax=Limosilactobacillus allomucosae TaxID=3142938 RepID=UPI0032637E4A